MKSNNLFSNKTSRRNFIGSSALLLGGTALSASQILGANDKVRIAIVGLRVKGNDLIQRFAALDNVKIVALCDVDSEILGKIASQQEPAIGKVDLITDFRKVLDRKDIDAVVLATPNHWHALQTIWSCQAGKDVYVEKPSCHTIWEGRKMIEAARKYDRIVQVGLQASSTSVLPEVAEYIRDGNLGAIEAIHAVFYKTRSSVGKRTEPLVPPASVDYDLWLGPAADLPIYRDKLHYDWHWNWNTGNGDIANIGCHVLDVARYILGDPQMDGDVVSLGNRFDWDDAEETPNMHIACYHYNGIPVMQEINALPTSRDAKRTPGFHKITTGQVVICEGGTFVGHGHGKVFDKSGKQIKKFYGTENHQKNFIDAVVSRKRETLNCELERGHASCVAPLLAGVAHQVGEPISPSELSEKFSDNPFIQDSIQRYQEQLDNLGIDLKKTPWIASTDLRFDSANETFVGGKHQSIANDLLKRAVYRDPYIVSDKV